jgi:hypothetical protein
MQRAVKKMGASFLNMVVLDVGYPNASLKQAENVPRGQTDLDGTGNR